MVRKFVHCWSGCGTASPPPYSSDATHAEGSGCGTASPPPYSSDATHAEGAEKADCESQPPLHSASSHFLSSVFFMDSGFC
ncbi:unnamed protein product [Sphagnum balticum]